MKYLPLFISLLIPFLTRSQTYDPMAIEGAHWIMFSIDANGPNHHVLTIRGDTTINGIDYKKMYRQELTSQATITVDIPPPYYFDSESLAGAIRDDIAAEKVYFYSFTQSFTAYDTCDMFKDLLLYDFSLSVGDTLFGCLQYYSEYPAVVDNLYSSFVYGKEREFLTGVNFATPLIEGIGTSLGPFWTVAFFPHPAKPTLLIDYCIGEDIDCNLVPTSSNEVLPELPVRIFPNPATDLLTIEWPEDLTGPVDMTIFDVSGKWIDSESHARVSSNSNLPISHLSPGIYLLRIQTEEGVWMGKFSKI